MESRHVEKSLLEMAQKLRQRYDARLKLDPHAIIETAEINQDIRKELKLKHYYVYLLDKINQSLIAKKMKSVYDKLSETANIFWYTWLGAVIITGITATFAPPFLTTIASSSIAMATVVNISYLIMNNLKIVPTLNKNMILFLWLGTALVCGLTAIYAPSLLTVITLSTTAISTIINAGYAIFHNPKIAPESDNEIEHIISTQKMLRLFLKNEHQYFKEKFTQILKKLEKENSNTQYQNHFPKLFKKKQYKSITEINAEIGQKEPIKDTYSQHLHYSEERHRRYFIISTTRAMMNHATTVLFIMWLIASTFSGLTYFPAIAVTMAKLAIFFANQPLGYKLAGLAIAITGIGSYLEHLTYKLRYEFKASLAGSAFYKPEKDPDDKHASKQTAFNILYSRTQQLNQQLTDAKNSIKFMRAMRKVKHRQVTEAISEAEEFILNLNIIDVTNDYFFQNMKEKPTKASLTKQGFNSLWTFYFGLQTWVINVKNLVQHGGPLAKLVTTLGIYTLGATQGPFIAFLTIAGLFGILGGTINLADNQMSSEDQQKFDFIENLDSRLSHLSKNYMKLDYACKLFALLNHSEKNQQAANPKVAARLKPTQTLFKSRPIQPLPTTKPAHQLPGHQQASPRHHGLKISTK